MKTIFADSFYWLALVNPRDQYHQPAVDASKALSGRLLTTEAVLVEVADALSPAQSRQLAVQIIDEIRGDGDVAVVPWSPDLFERALVFYRARPDKDWGLTDCVSFLTMQDEGITEALTGDHHFEQAGFRALLRT